MTIRLIAIDLDGTLLKDNLTISKASKIAIQKAVEQGIKVVICTGRPEPGILPYIAELGLSKKDDYTITYNGGLLRRTDTKEIIIRHQLTIEDYRNIYAETKQLNVRHHMISDDGIATDDKSISKYTVHEADISRTGILVKGLDEYPDDFIVSKVLWSDDEEVLDRALEQIDPSFYDKYSILRSEPFYLEFLNKNASKGKTVRELASILDISLDQVMAIGNANNDFDMVKEAGIGVAVANSTPELKDVADYISSSNEEDGVAQAIHKFVL